MLMLMLMLSRFTLVITRHKHKHKHKKKEKFPFSYAYAYAYVTTVHTYAFLCLCLCHKCEPALRNNVNFNNWLNFSRLKKQFSLISQTKRYFDTAREIQEDTKRQLPGNGDYRWVSR